MKCSTLQPEENVSEGFRRFTENYRRGLAAEYAAVKKYTENIQIPRSVPAIWGIIV